MHIYLFTFTNNSIDHFGSLWGGKKISTRKDKTYPFSSTQWSLVTINLKILMKDYSFWGEKEGILLKDNFICKTKGFWLDLNDQINKSLGICMSTTDMHKHSPVSSLYFLYCELCTKCMPKCFQFQFFGWF